MKPAGLNFVKSKLNSCYISPVDLRVFRAAIMHETFLQPNGHLDSAPLLPQAPCKTLEKLLESFIQNGGVNTALVKKCQGFGLDACTSFCTSMDVVSLFYSAMVAVLYVSYKLNVSYKFKASLYFNFLYI